MDRECSEVLYVITGDDVRPADVLAADLATRVDGATVLRFCRDAPAGCPPERLPEPFPSESWLVTAEWLAELLDGALERVNASLLSRLVVRVEWPVPYDVETVLLRARLVTGALRVSVSLPADSAEDTFLYFNRLGFSWIGVPDSSLSAWTDALLDCARLWCADPRACTPMEPVQSAFTQLIRSHTATNVDWSYRVVHSPTGRIQPARAWSSSAHAAFIGCGLLSLTYPHAALAAADAELCRYLELDAAGAASASSPSRPRSAAEVLP